MLAATAATAVDSGHWIYFQHVFARPFRVLRVCYVGSLLPEWHYYPINMVCLILFILLFTSLSVRSRMKMTHYALVQCPQYYLSLYYRQLKRERERETPDNFYFPFTSLHRSNASFWGIYSILIDIYLSHNNAHKMCVCVCVRIRSIITREGWESVMTNRWKWSCQTQCSVMLQLVLTANGSSHPTRNSINIEKKQMTLANAGVCASEQKNASVFFSRLI